MKTEKVVKKSPKNKEKTANFAKKDEKMVEKFEKICHFYALIHKLKNVLRSGYLQWHIQAERFESVAEHIFATQMLAFAINSELNLGLNIEKIVFMLAFHELGEVLIGDITIMDGVSKEEKHRRECEAVEEILKPLADKERILKIWEEFDAEKTKEAIFAKVIDHFESNLQIKFHEEMGQNNMKKPLGKEAEKILSEPNFRRCKSLAELWIEWHKQFYDEIFQALSDHILSHDIFKDIYGK